MSCSDLNQSIEEKKENNSKFGGDNGLSYGLHTNMGQRY